MSHRVGLGTVVIIPERPITKSDIPNQHAHQSSVFVREIKMVFNEMLITYTSNILMSIYYFSICFFQVLDFHNKHLYGLSFWSTFGRINKKGGLAGEIFR
jgi:hypothetical protein